MNIRSTFSLVILSFLCIMPLVGQETDEETKAWVQAMLEGAEAVYNPEIARASIGEIEMNQGLWLPEVEKRFGGELLSFDAIPGKNGVELIWTTAIEENSNYFKLERQQENHTFATISIQKAAGYSRNIKTYQVIDDHPRAGENVYVLRQYDHTGLVHETSPIKVMFGSPGQLPVASHLKVQDEFLNIMNQSGMVRISIIDSNGEVMVATEKTSDTHARIDIGTLKPGSYAVKVDDGKQIRYLEFEKKK